VKGKLLDKLHRWFGLAALVLLVLQAVTGAVIVNGERTQQWLEPELYRLDEPSSLTASLDSLAGAALTAEGQTVASLILPESPTSPVLAVVVPAGEAMPEMVALDPGTARVIGRSPVLTNPVVIANLLHGELGAGLGGRAILMATGIALVLLSVTGVLRWWPGAEKLRRSLRLRWAGSLAASVWQWHGVLGAVLALLFVWLGLTGAMLVGRPFLEPLVTQDSTSRFPDLGSARSDHAVPLGAISMDDAFAIARTRMGEDELRSILPLSRLNEVHSFVFSDRQGRMGVVRVASDGAITETYRPSDMPAANRTLDWMLPLHRGTMLPEWLRTIYYAIALGLTFIAGSGLFINRRKARLRKARKF
jgi:uncharacterized iron-regulated membrane protein